MMSAWPYQKGCNCRRCEEMAASAGYRPSFSDSPSQDPQQQTPAHYLAPDGGLTPWPAGSHPFQRQQKIPQYRSARGELQPQQRDRSVTAYHPAPPRADHRYAQGALFNDEHNVLDQLAQELRPETGDRRLPATNSSRQDIREVYRRGVHVTAGREGHRPVIVNAQSRYYSPPPPPLQQALQTLHNEIDTQQDEFAQREEALGRRESILQAREAGFQRRLDALRYREEDLHQSQSSLAKREMQLDGRLRDLDLPQPRPKRKYQAGEQTMPYGNMDHGFRQGFAEGRRMLQPVSRRRRGHDGAVSPVIGDTVSGYGRTAVHWGEKDGGEEDKEYEEEDSVRPVKRRRGNPYSHGDAPGYAPRSVNSSYHQDFRLDRSRNRLPHHRLPGRRAELSPDLLRRTRTRVSPSIQNSRHAIPKYAGHTNNYDFGLAAGGYEYGGEDQRSQRNGSSRYMQDYSEDRNSYDGPAELHHGNSESQEDINGRGLSYPWSFAWSPARDERNWRSQLSDRGLQNHNLEDGDKRSQRPGFSISYSAEDGHGLQDGCPAPGYLRSHDAASPLLQDESYIPLSPENRDRSSTDWPNELDYGAPNALALVSRHRWPSPYGRPTSPTVFQNLMEQIGKGMAEDEGDVRTGRICQWAAEQHPNAQEPAAAAQDQAKRARNARLSAGSRYGGAASFRLRYAEAGLRGEDQWYSNSRGYNGEEMRTVDASAGAAGRSMRGSQGRMRGPRRDETPLYGFGASDGNMDEESAAEFERKALRRENWTREHNSDVA